jgi:hypothetical protein
LPGDGDRDVVAEHPGQYRGGRSVASWNRAADRDWPQRMPIWRSRSASWKALIDGGRPAAFKVLRQGVDPDLP